MTFVWIYEDTGDDIDHGEIITHIGGNNSLLFKVDPNTNSTGIFGTKEYLKRVNITIPVPLKLSLISARMVLSNVTTADTGFYSFKVIGLVNAGNLSNVSLYVTERPHSLHINNTESVNIAKEIGESLYVKCQVSGAPTPTVTWVNKNNEQEAIGSGSAVLSLNHITEQHQGMYTCKGNNSEGEVQSSISLNVIYLHLNCSAPFSKDNKMFVNLTAVGNPAPVCTHNNIDINCLGELVELTRNYFNLSLSARNTAGLERSCRRSAKFGQPSGTTVQSHSVLLLSHSVLLLAALFLTTFLL